MAMFIYNESSIPMENPNPDQISYDTKTNTLTLNNYHGSSIRFQQVGSGFTIKLIGENELTGSLEGQGGCITFTGNGSLTVNKAGKEIFGISLFGYSTQCIMIDRNVTLDIYGSVAIDDSNAEKAIYYLSDTPLSDVRQVRSEYGTRHPYQDSDELYYSFFLARCVNYLFRYCSCGKTILRLTKTDLIISLFHEMLERCFPGWYNKQKERYGALR